MHDVIIVGGGAMGSAAAWALTLAGREVLLLERFAPGHDRGGSHGATRIFRLGYAEPDYVRLAQRALREWRDLESESGLSLLVTTGAIDHGRASPATEFASLAALGVPFEILDAPEAGRRWPGMAFETPVLHQPEGGRLRADAAIEALQRLAAAGGAEIRHGHAVTAMSVRGDSVAVDTVAGTLSARQVVVAAGPWAPALLRGVVDLPPLTVTQEEPAHFAVRDPAYDWPSFVHWRPDTAARYGLFAPGEGLKVGLHGSGPVVDPDDRDFTATEAGSRALREYVERWLPGADAATATPVSCLYDNTAAGDFVLDRVGPVTVATGFSGHGFKFVPVIGRILADLVTGAGPAPARFSLAAHA